MAEEYINSIIGDNPEREADALISKLMKVIDLQLEVIRNSKEASSNGGAPNMQSAVNGMQQFATSIKQANASLNEQSRLWKQTTELIAQQNGHSKEFATVLGKLAIAEREVSKAATEGARAESIAADVRIKNARAYGAELKNQAAAGKAAQSAIDPTSLKALSDRLNDLRNGYQRLTQAERDNAEIGGVVLARIKELDVQMKAADASQGKFNRNVGNYNGAVEGFKLQITQIARELPSLALGLSTFAIAIGNNLPYAQEAFIRLREENVKLRAEGKPTASVFKTLTASIFSWQTALIVALTVLPGLIKYLQQGSKAAAAAQKANEKYKQSLDSIGESARASAQEEIAHANVLVTVAKNTTESMKNRLRAVKELQETYPDRFGALTKEAILEGNVADALERTTRELLKKAAAQAAEKRFAAASERVYDLTLAQKTALEELSKAEKEEAAQRASLEASGYTPTGRAGARVEKAQAALDDIVRQNNAARKEQQGFLADARKFAQEAGDSLFGNDKKERTPRTPIPNDYYQQDISAQRKAIEEKSKMRQADLKEDEADFKRIADDEHETLQVRLAAYQVYLTDKKALIEQEKNAQIDAARNTISELEKEQERNNSLIGGGKLSATQKSSLQEKNKAITEQITALNAEILRLDRERTTEQRIAEQESAKDIEQIRKSSISEQIKTITEGLVDIANETSDHYREQKDNLQAQSDDDVITFQQYKTAISKIDAKENNETIAKQKAFAKDALKQLLKEADVPPEVIRAIRARIDALYDKPQRNDSNRGVLNLTDEQRQQLTLAESYVDIAINSQKVITAFYEAASQKRIDAIDAEIDKIKERAEAEIDAVQTSAAYAMLSEQEKKDKISEINAIARQKEKDLERDKIAEMRRRAIYEKAITIASIIAKTALAVLVQLSTGDGYTAFARALAAGAAGAAELATAIAAPLPQYRMGEEDTGEAHFGVVGDGNKQEVVETKDGTYITPDKPTVTYLPAHSRVYPSVEDYIDRAHNYTFQGMGTLKRLDERSGLSTKKMESLLRRVANATEALQGKNPIVIKQDWSQSYYLKVKQ